MSTTVKEVFPASPEGLEEMAAKAAAKRVEASDKLSSLIVGEVTKPAKGFDANAEQTIAGLNARIVQLEAKLAKGDKPKLPVTDEDLGKAIAALQSEGDKDLSSGNPAPVPNLSLAGKLGFIPLLTKEQRAQWVPVRDGLRKAYSQAHRRLLPQRKAVFGRLVRQPATLVSTNETKRKDGTVARVSLAARTIATKKRKVDAKPRQIAAKVPVAPNAQPPASVK